MLRNLSQVCVRSFVNMVLEFVEVSATENQAWLSTLVRQPIGTALGLLVWKLTRPTFCYYYPHISINLALVQKWWIFEYLLMTCGRIKNKIKTSCYIYLN